MSRPKNLVAAWLTRWEWGILLLLAPLLLFPTTTYGLALTMVLALWVLRWVATGAVVPRTPLDWPLALLLGMVAISLLVTMDPLFSLPKVTGVVLGVTFYYALVSQARLRGGVAVAIGLLLLVAVGVAGISLMATDWTSKIPALASVTARLPRALRDLPGSPPDGFNPNSVAGSLALVTPLALCLAWPIRNRLFEAVPRRLRGLTWLVCLLMAGLIAGTTLLTQSRAGYLGLAVGLLALALLPRPRLAALMVGVVAAALVGLLVARPTALVARYESLVSGGAGATDLGSLVGRAAIWQRAIYGIQDFPWTGMGMGMFRHVVPLMYPMYSVPPEPDIGHAHNHLLAAGVDLGVPGLVAYLALWLGAGAMGWQVWHGAASPAHRWLVLGLLAGLAAHFTWGMVDANVLGSKGGLLFWLTLAALATVHRAAQGAAL